MVVFSGPPKKVAVITRRPYYRGSCKAGFHCISNGAFCVRLSALNGINLDLQIPCDIAPFSAGSRPCDRGGGGCLGRPLDKWGARSPKNFFRPFGPLFGLNVRGADSPAPPLDPPLPFTVLCQLRRPINHKHRMLTQETTGQRGWFY